MRTWPFIRKRSPRFHKRKNTFYLKNPHRAMGGFRRSLTKNRQRCDYTQHCVMALMMTLENGFFQ